MSKTVVIVGTDTGVGKSFVAALLLDFLQQRQESAGYVKLVSCGGEGAGDCAFCRGFAGLDDEQATALYHFPLAASPHLAARQQGRQVDEDLLRQGIGLAAERFPFVLVEGVGGLLVPLREDLLLADFLAAEKLPLILVARSGLGTLNHTLLTLEAARQRSLDIKGILFSDEGEYAPHDLLVNDNIQTITSQANVALLGRLPRCRSKEEARQAFAAIGEAIIARV